MPIVLKYGNPGLILEAGFAGGVGHRQHEQQDDALKIWQQQQYQNFQAQQAAYNRLLNVGMQQLGFQNQAAQQQRAQDFAAGQATRARGFQAGQAELARDFQRGQQQNALDAMDRRQSANDVRDFYTRTFFSLPQIPEFTDPAQRKLLTDSRSAIQGLLSKGFDTSDPEVRKKLDEQIAAYSSGVSAVHSSYSAAAAANRNTIYRDAQGKAYDEAGEGRTAYDLKTGKPLLEDQAAAQAKAVAAQQKQADQNEAQIKKFYADNRKEVDDKGKPKYSTPEDAMKAAIAEHNAVQGMLHPAAPLLGGAVANATAPANVAPPPAAAAAPAVAQQPAQALAAINPAITQATPYTTAPSAKFDLGELPSNMLQVPQNQRQTFVENMPQHINELPSNYRQFYTNAWPKPATPEEASKLAPGTVFLTPDGRIKTVPF